MTTTVNGVQVSSGRWAARGRSMEVTVWGDDGVLSSFQFSWGEWDADDIRHRYGR